MINNDILIGHFKCRDHVIIELGCGEVKKYSNSIGIDMLPYSAVDIIGDVIEVLKAIPDKCVDKIYSRHFMSHVDDLYELFYQMDRVLKSGGINEIVVPHFSNPYWYSDYTHRIFFGIYTFAYFFETDYFKRKVPKYGNKFNYEIKSIKLKFKTDKSFLLIYFIKSLINLVVNLSSYVQEVYEGSFTGIFSCHEIEFILIKK